MNATPLVLLVDDYPDTRDLYGTYLRTRGYRTEEAEDGVEGLAKAIDLHPSVVLMDLAMPNMNGWDATRLMKGDPRTTSIPVICLTAHGRDEFRKSAFDAGCVGFLTKPCLPSEVLREVQRVLSAT
ncbi:MAG TPA: response regulator [Luteitalea sp.]|nr:response regulator [Luteitalea sp.]